MEKSKYLMIEVLLGMVEYGIKYGIVEILILLIIQILTIITIVDM